MIDGAKVLSAAVRAGSAIAPRSRGAFVTRRGTSSSTCPSATVPPSACPRAPQPPLLRELTAELERSHPGAAGSLRDGLEKSLTRLGVTGALKRTLESTKPRESMIECVRRSSRNVKRWHTGELALRWTAAGMLEAERQFCMIIGFSDLAKLAVTVERELTRPQPNPVASQEAAIVATA